MPEEFKLKDDKDLGPYERALTGWMQKVKPEAEGVRVFDLSVPQGIGHSNETVFYSAAWRDGAGEQSARYVARIEPPDGGVFPEQTPECKVSVQVQHRMMSVVAGASAAPVPPLLPYEPDPSVLGQPFFAMEFVAGQIPLDNPRYSQQGFLVDEATPEERTRLVHSGLEAMAQVHTIDWREVDLGWLDITQGKRKASLQDQIDLYRSWSLGELGEREHPVLMNTLDWLERNMPDAEVALSWGDARIGNQIHADYRTAAVVDWEAACIGARELDIGWWIMFDRMSYERMGQARQPGMPTSEEQLAYYEAQIGHPIAGDIHYWETFAVMRFNAIFIKLMDRHVREGRIPPEHSMAVDNFLTDQLAEMIA